MKVHGEMHGVKGKLTRTINKKTIRFMGGFPAKATAVMDVDSNGRVYLVLGNEAYEANILTKKKLKKLSNESINRMLKRMEKAI